MLNRMHDDVLLNVFQQLSNVHTIQALGATCKSISESWKRIQPALLRKHRFPNLEAKEQNSVENLLHQARIRCSGWIICKVCSWCGDMMPIDVETMMIAHTCDGLLHPLNSSSHRDTILWHGPTVHLKKPEKCHPMVLRMHGYITHPIFDELTGRLV